MQNQINSQAGGHVRINAKEFSSKGQSKNEIFRILAIDVNIYLPPYEAVTMYFLKDIVTGKAKYIKANKARHLYVPHYEGLTQKDIVRYALADPQWRPYFPVDKEVDKLPRQYVINLAYSLIGDKFEQWVKEIITNRNIHIQEERNLYIEMDAEIANAFRESTAVSLTKGRGVHMLKIGSKRRRNKEEMLADKEEAIVKQGAVSNKLQQLQDMQAKIEQLEEENRNNQAANLILQDLVQSGRASVDAEGHVTVTNGNHEVETPMDNQ